MYLIIVKSVVISRCNMFFWIKKNFQSLCQKDIYLDHASTTPIDLSVLSVMNDIMKNAYGNPGGMYPLAIKTKQIINGARRNVATLIGTTSDHIVFTRGGTESNNIALLGLVEHFKKNNSNIVPHIITSTIEHDSILEICRHLENSKQAEVSYVPCDKDGVIDMTELKKALRPTTILVTVMYANNEIGTIQPIRDIAKLVRWYKKQLKENNTAVIDAIYPLVHTDAIQVVNYCDINTARLGVDMMTMSGSKIYGPKSVGVLFMKDKTLCDPIMFGGGQESGLRSGTEDSAVISGFAKALEISQDKKESETKRLTILRDECISELLKDERVILNGSQKDRLPNNINITVKGFSGESLVIQLAACGFSVSSKSACQSDSDEESHVIAALRTAQGISSKSEEGSLRITLGRNTSKNDINKFINALTKITK